MHVLGQGTRVHGDLGSTPSHWLFSARFEIEARCTIAPALFQHGDFEMGPRRRMRGSVAVARDALTIRSVVGSLRPPLAVRPSSPSLSGLWNATTNTASRQARAAVGPFPARPPTPPPRFRGPCVAPTLRRRSRLRRGLRRTRLSRPPTAAEAASTRRGNRSFGPCGESSPRPRGPISNVAALPCPARTSTDGGRLDPAASIRRRTGASSPSPHRLDPRLVHLTALLHRASTQDPALLFASWGACV